MKILIASDIHGSAYYTKKLCKVFIEKKADLMVLLGDIYNHGPRNPLPKEYNPIEVARLLNEQKHNLMVIKGNCDSDVDTLISEFDFVDFGQIFDEGTRITLTHGHKFNKDNMPTNVGKFMFYGHFHKSFVIDIDGITVANPGSVSLPKDDIHSYIIFEKGKIKIFDIENENIVFEK